MDWQLELKEYIEKCRNLGFSENEIRAVLRSVGWKDDDINNGMMRFPQNDEKVVRCPDPDSSHPEPAGEGSPDPKILRFAQNDGKIACHPEPDSGHPEEVSDEGSPRFFGRRLLQNDKKSELMPSGPSFLLLSSVDEKFPAAVKTAIPLLLSSLSRRAEALKRAARAVRSSPMKLLAASKRETLAIAAPSSTGPLLLAAPSRRAIWLIRLQSIAESVFSKIESAVLIAGKIILLPVAFFGIVSRSLANTARAVSALYGKTEINKGDIGKESASPAVMLIGEKFPEHIVFLDIFKLAGRMFRTRRLRTLLTISGISVGIGTILFLVSFGYGLQNILFERITTEEALLTLDVVPPADSVVIVIDSALVEKVSAIDGVAEVSKMVALNGEMVFGDSSAAGFIYAVDAQYPQMLGIKDAAVDFADSVDRGAVIVSSAAAKLLGWGDSPDEALNKELSFIAALPKESGGEVETVSISGKFRVAGVVDDSFSVFAYFPIEKMSGLKLPPYSQLKVKVRDTNLLEPTRDNILKMGLLVSMLTETVEQARKVFNVVKLILGLFGVITLVVSAIGMLNTLTIALLERTQEVGIMKAVGASDFDVWKLFLAEAVVMGFLGGMGGIAIGYISAEIFNYGINFLAKTFGGQSLNLFQAPAWFVLTIVAFSSCIGIVTGLWPARRAAHLDPLDALKYK